MHMAKKKASRTTTTRRPAAKRESIDTGSDKRFVRRGKSGQFKDSDDVGRSLTRDRRTKAKTSVKAARVTRATVRVEADSIIALNDDTYPN